VLTFPVFALAGYFFVVGLAVVITFAYNASQGSRGADKVHAVIFASGALAAGGLAGRYFIRARAKAQTQTSYSGELLYRSTRAAILGAVVLLPFLILGFIAAP
jgi:hypothetical protein